MVASGCCRGTVIETSGRAKRNLLQALVGCVRPGADERGPDDDPVGVCGSSPAFLFARVFATTPLAWLLCPRAFGLRRSGGGQCFTSPDAIVVV